MQRLKALDARHKAACRMKIEGKDNDFIASELNMSKRTLVLWFSDDLVKEYLQQLAENVEAEFAQQLATSGMIAITELTKLVQKSDRDPDISTDGKLRVAREILDRLPGTSRIADRPQLPPGESNYLAVFANLGDDKLAAFIRNWEQGAGNPAPAIDSTATES